MMPIPRTYFHVPTKFVCPSNLQGWKVARRILATPTTNHKNTWESAGFKVGYYVVGIFVILYLGYEMLFNIVFKEYIAYHVIIGDMPHCTRLDFMKISQRDHTPLHFITTCDKICYPVLYALYIFTKLCYLLYLYITIYSIFFKISNFFVIFIFVVIVLVQFCIILVRNGVFCENHKSSYSVTIFNCVIDTVYTYSWKKLIKIWPIFVTLYVQSRFIFLSHVVIKFDYRVNPLRANIISIFGEEREMGVLQTSLFICLGFCARWITVMASSFTLQCIPTTWTCGY